MCVQGFIDVFAQDTAKVAPIMEANVAWYPVGRVSYLGSLNRNMDEPLTRI
ncbi:MAG: hypothetical protein JWO42_1385 [Chloroflexi bacterium]|jgi:hypothetical protein|nr:hypothetical protein [Chloroflexota bacterium]